MADTFDFDDGEADAPPNPMPGFTPATGENTTLNPAGGAGAKTQPTPGICWPCALTLVVIVGAVWYLFFRKKR